MKREHLLILRPDNIGDVVLFSGALRHIRALYPSAHLTLAVQAHIVNLVELCPYVDACIPVGELIWWDRFNLAGLPLIRRCEQLVRGLNRAWNRVFRRFDGIIYPVKSPPLRHLQLLRDLNVGKVFGISGCDVNAPPEGYPQALRPEVLFSCRLDVSEGDQWRHELLTTLDYLRFLGCQEISPDDIRPEFWLSAADLDALHDVHAAERKIVGLFPGASSMRRCWEPHNYGGFAVMMGEGYTYAIFGGTADRDMAARVSESISKSIAGVEIINLAGETTLRELVKSIRSCDLFIGMESAGLHIAVAQGVPSIGILGGGHYGRFAPWGEAEWNFYLTKHMDCYYCNWLCDKERLECIQSVSARELADVAMRLLTRFV